MDLGDNLKWEGGDLKEFPSRPIRKCPKCGMDLHEVMGYFCRRFPCPAGLGSRSFM